MASNNHTHPPQVPIPLILRSAPLPPNHQATSWLEVSLRDRQLSLQAIVDNKPIALLIQNPAYLAQVVKEGLDYAIEELGNQLWTETLRRNQLLDNINARFWELDDQTFQSLPFFLSFPYLPNNQTLNFLTMMTPGTTNPNY